MANPSTARWWVLGCAAFVCALLYGRALIESRASLLQGDALRGTDPAGAVTEYRHAVEWYAPGNPYTRQAVRALLDIGAQAPDTPQGSALALAAYEHLRSGLLVTRSLYTPYADAVATAEREIARLRGREAAGDDPTRIDQETARQLDLLQASRARAPSPLWSAVTVVGFVAWLLLTWLFFRGSRRSERAMRHRHALVTGLSAAAALALWIVGLTLV